MNMCEFIQLQKTEIEKHRWIESEKAHKNLGQEAEFDWIEKYAQIFRKKIEAEYGGIK